MRLVLVVLTFAFVGCVAAGEPARRHRWPKHREEKDQKIEELLVRVDKLEKELAETRAQIAKLPARAPMTEASSASPPDAAPAR
jgi:hypothetical protein